MIQSKATKLNKDLHVLREAHNLLVTEVRQLITRIEKLEDETRKQKKTAISPRDESRRGPRV